MRLDDSGRLLIGTTTEGHASADNLTIADSGNAGITIRSGTTSNGCIFFSDATSGDAEFDGFVQYNHGAAPFMQFGVADDTVMALKGINVGIGTTSPSTNLHVRGADGAAPKITLSEGSPESAIRSTASGTNSDLRLMTSVSGSQATKLIVDYAGNVGVGTGDTAPNAKLEVASADSTYALKLTCSENVSGSYNGLSIAGADENSGSYPLVVVSNSTTHETGGHPILCCTQRKVGVGTLTPTAYLDVVSNAASGYVAEFRQSNASNSAQILIDSPTDADTRPALIDLARAGTVKWSIGQGYNATGGHLYFATSSLSSGVTDAKVVIETGGHVGIGTTSPNQNLMVMDTIANEPQIRIETSDGGSKRLDLFVDSSAVATISAQQSAQDISIKARNNTIFTQGSTAAEVESMRITNTGKLQIKGTRSGALQASDDDTLQLYTKSTSDDINRGTGITFYNHDGSGHEMGGTIQVAKENGNANDVASYMRFSTRPAGGSATERVRIKSDGDVEINTGNIKFGTAGKGISFSETSDATGKDNELFDDYEEGTFSFTTRGFAGGFDANYALANQTGKYTKIGRHVLLKGGFSMSGNSGNIGASDYFTVYMSSLPFTMDDSSSGATGAIISHQGSWWAYTSLGGGSNAKGSVIAVYNDYLSFYCTSVTGSPSRNSNEITFTISYTST